MGVVFRVSANPDRNTMNMTPFIRTMQQLMGENPGISFKVLDPFARYSASKTYPTPNGPKDKFVTSTSCMSNDMDKSIRSNKYHLDYRDFLKEMHRVKARAHAVVLDPPFTSNQDITMYEGKERKLTESDVRDMYSLSKSKLHGLLYPGGLAFTLGYTADGFESMFPGHYERIATIVAACGGAHNAIILVVEKKRGVPLPGLSYGPIHGGSLMLSSRDFVKAQPSFKASLKKDSPTQNVAVKYEQSKFGRKLRSDEIIEIDMTKPDYCHRKTLRRLRDIKPGRVVAARVKQPMSAGHIADTSVSHATVLSDVNKALRRLLLGRQSMVTTEGPAAAGVNLKFGGKHEYMTVLHNTNAHAKIVMGSTFAA